MSIPVLNFSTESVKELTIYDLLFLIAIYSPNNDNMHPSEMRNWYHNSPFAVSEVFIGWGPILTRGLKY